MTHPIYSDTSLKSFTLSRLKDIGSGFNLNPDGDKRLKATWVRAILKYQAQVIQLITPDDSEHPNYGDESAPVIADFYIGDDETIPEIEIDDSLICNELGLTFRNPHPECTRRGHIEPSGSIVCEIYQDDRHIGNIRRYYIAAGLFYTPDRNWDGTEYSTHYAAALSLLDSGDVEITRAIVERNEDDRYIAAYIPAPNYLPSSDEFRVTNYSPKDRSEAAQLRQLLENGGRWFSVYSDGVVDDAGISKGESYCIGHIQTSPGRYRVCITGQKGGLFIDTFDGALQAVKLGWIEVQATRTHKRLWSAYLGLPQLVYA